MYEIDFTIRRPALSKLDFINARNNIRIQNFETIYESCKAIKKYARELGINKSAIFDNGNIIKFFSNDGSQSKLFQSTVITIKMINGRYIVEDVSRESIKAGTTQVNIIIKNKEKLSKQLSNVVFKAIPALPCGYKETPYSPFLVRNVVEEDVSADDVESISW